MKKKNFIKVEGNLNDPNVQKARLCQVFEMVTNLMLPSKIKKDLEEGKNVMYSGDHKKYIKDYVLDTFELFKKEIPCTIEFIEKTFDIWWEDGLEKALNTNY